MRSHDDTLLRANRPAVLLCAVALLAGCTGQLDTSEISSRRSDAPATGSIDSNPGGSSERGQMTDRGAEPALQPFGELRPQEYARKVKFLLHGGALQDQELARVNEDPRAMRALIAEWIETDPFRDKMLEFLIDTLQQRYGITRTTKFDTASQLRGDDDIFEYNPPSLLHDNLIEMFARTAMGIIERREPFHAIATTRRWMTTTGALTYIMAADLRTEFSTDNLIPEHRFYHRPFSSFDADTSLDRQFKTRTWYMDRPIAGFKDRDDCPDPFVLNDKGRVFSALHGVFRCAHNTGGGPLKQSDYRDWREVEFTALRDEGDRIAFYDIEKLRDARSIPTTIPRVGFFTTPAYLALWRTNTDNSFRVTTNQALIVALGESFDSETFTLPLTQDNLDEEHAAPGTVCYGCHVGLDPMRNYFALTFEPESYIPLLPDERPEVEPSFGFMGHQRQGSRLDDFGQAIATHPRFAAGWVQKMCMFANSQQCDPQDPEFQRVEQAFIDSDFDFKAMLIELFSSPLITSAERTATYDRTDYKASLTRRLHLCHALRTRFDEAQLTLDACEEDPLARAVPEDEWTRGATSPFQPASSSLFYSATLESFCDRLGAKLGGMSRSPLRERADQESVLDFLVQHVMGLPPSDTRHGPVRELVREHMTRASTASSTTQGRRSAFTLACSSPLLSSVDF